MNKRIGLYAGSFDPLTYGHLSIINNAQSLFDKFYIGVGTNADKKHMFDSNTRANIIRNTIDEDDGDHEIITYDNEFLSRIARKYDVTHIVRGMRNSKDFEEERALKNVLWNHFGLIIRFVYILPDPETEYLSSTLVKSCMPYDGWEDVVRRMVPPESLEAMKALMEKK